MTIREVSSDRDRKDFLELPVHLYKDDSNWSRPLDKDIEAVFEPSENKFFRHGRCTRFLLQDGKGETIGRIAAFINDRTAKKEAQPTGGVGFFECINDQSAANLLLDTAKQWLAERGMEAMDGPINFGERDSWWGMIVEGFDPVPYKMNYNPPYYNTLFANYGFRTYFEQWCYSLRVHEPLADKFQIRHEQLKKEKNYKAVHLKKSSLEKFAEDFRTIYNKAWAKHGGGKELESKQVQQFFRKMKPVIDPKAVWFVYYGNEPVAMFINLPDINQLFRQFNGKFGWQEKLKFLWKLKTGKVNKLIGLVFGIVPEHQGKGVDSFMIVESANYIRKHTQYNDYEMQWIGDFNPKMVSVAESLGTVRSRVLMTYRYLFDRQKEFVRHPML